MKTCTGCLQEKPLEAFGKDKSTKDGLSRRCKECRNAYFSKNNVKHRAKKNAYDAEWRRRNKAHVLKYQYEYYQKNKSWMVERQRQYLLKHPEVRARVRGRRRLQEKQNSFVILAKDIRRLMQRPCYGCGSRERLTIDHIIPLSRGGTHGIGNLEVLCHSCNSSKGKKFISEWKRDRPGLRFMEGR